MKNHLSYKNQNKNDTTLKNSTPAVFSRNQMTQPFCQENMGIAVATAKTEKPRFDPFEKEM